MTPEDFSSRAEAFAAEMQSLLNDCYPEEVKLAHTLFNGETFMGSFTIKVTLKSPGKSQQVGELEANFRLGLDRSEEDMCVEGSSFSVRAVRGVRVNLPVVRFEYERNARAVPASHMHVHSDMAGLAIILHTNGRTEQSLHQQEIHYPGGGHLYRVALEDVIQFTINELGFVGEDGWFDVVNEGRERFRRGQARAAIRQNHEDAAAVLRSLGYKVEGGPTDTVPPPRIDW